jgi:hypothetical protein
MAWHPNRKNLYGSIIYRHLNWISAWNWIVIEQNLRKFIALLTNVADIERFLDLNRNTKYRTLPTNWTLTFNNLQGIKGFLATSFIKESIFKKEKIKLLSLNWRIINDWTIEKSMYAFVNVLYVIKMINLLIMFGCVTNNKR